MKSVLVLTTLCITLLACGQQHGDSRTLLANKVRCSQVGEQWFRRRAVDEGWQVSRALITVSPRDDLFRGPWFAYNAKLDTCLCAYGTYKLQGDDLVRCWVWDTLSNTQVAYSQTVNRKVTVGLSETEFDKRLKELMKTDENCFVK